jgi:nucleoside-diphosphate-sugar epimerase
MTVARPILVTGHRGYIGSVMTPYLAANGYHVVGLDTGYFNECTLVEDGPTIEELVKDIRDVERGDLSDIYAVIHLAALSNDPIGNLDETWTEDINHHATIRLATLAKAASVRRFLFSSSCIMYGMSSLETVDETAPLAPETIYARSKVASEETLRELGDGRFHPTYLRNGTVYGLSPRMRFDTVLNNLVGQAVTTGEVVVLSDGTPWRPVVHVEDIARSFHHVLEAPVESISNQAFNNGADELNHRVIDLARIAASVVEDAEVVVRSEAGADQRTYRADFSKFAKTFPDFRWKWNAVEGARQVADGLTSIGLTQADLDGDLFVRLRWLRRLLASGRLDDNLRWEPASGA